MKRKLIIISILLLVGFVFFVPVFNILDFSVCSLPFIDIDPKTGKEIPCERTRKGPLFQYIRMKWYISNNQYWKI